MDEPATVVLECHPCARDLPPARLPAKLPDEFDDLGDPGGADHMPLGEQAPARIDRSLSADSGIPLFDEPASLPFASES